MLKPLPYRTVKRKLEAVGFEERPAKGSHRKFVKFTREGVITAIVPQHRILRQAIITPQEFDEL